MEYFLTQICMGIPQQYQCVKCTTKLTTDEAGNGSKVLQELCFMEGSPLFGGPDRADLGITVEADKGTLNLGDPQPGDIVGEVRFDVDLTDFGEQCDAGNIARLVAPIKITGMVVGGVGVEAKIKEASDPLKVCVLRYDPTDKAHNNGLMFQGTLAAGVNGGFKLFLHLAALVEDASFPGLEYGDLAGVGSPVPVFFEPIVDEAKFILPNEGGILTVTTTLSALNETPEVVSTSFEESFEIKGGTVLPRFRRGDSNRDGAANIADAIFILQNLFAQGPPLLCMDSADANDDESVNIADGVYVLQRLFAQGPPIPPPQPGCGTDNTPHPMGGPNLPDCNYCAEACQEPPVACVQP